MIIQENSKTGALLIQIPKAIAEGKNLKKGMDVKFKIEDVSGRLYLDIERDNNETNNV